ILKNLSFIGLIVVGALFIYIGITPDQITNFIIGFSLICLGASLIQIQRRTEEPIRQTLTILKCSKCDSIKVRNYENGDYVFKVSGLCDQCNGPMGIHQIYSVKLKKPSVQVKKSDIVKLQSKT
ncbi:MAG: hypothetical protein P8Y23_01250, partial [Candidatus Lokiarchaeota archaeon]